MTAEKHQMEQLNLSNEDRKYLGLTPIGENWETMRINDNTLYFDGDIVRKMITHNYSETWGYSYSEFDECINPDYAIGTFWFRFMGKSHSPMNHFRRFLVSAIFSLSVSPALSKYAPMLKVR